MRTPVDATFDAYIEIDSLRAEVVAETLATTPIPGLIVSLRLIAPQQPSQNRIGQRVLGTTIGTVRIVPIHGIKPPIISVVVRVGILSILRPVSLLTLDRLRP